MLSTHWEEVKSVFEAALLQDERDREEFVSSRCGDDHALAEEVRRLLAADRESSKFLEEATLSRAIRSSILPCNELLARDEVLCGRFKVLDCLGEGGMGQVYKAADLELRQVIAIKAIRPGIADAPGVLSRFKREVSATRKVTHPNVCRTFDLETHTPAADESGRPRTPITFLTMELLVGETLAERLHRAGPLAAEQGGVFARQVALALQAAHSAGVIHCDLKPSNIFLSGTESEPRYVVTDFGLAKLTLSQEQTGASLFTLSNTPNGAAGTPFYMAPEQFETGDASPASDVYSVGLVLYEALTGQKLSPYRRSRNELETALSKLDATPDAAKLGALDPAWIEIIAKCVKPNPADRFDNVQQILDCLPTGTGHPLAVRLHSDAPAFAGDEGGRRTVASKWNAIPWLVRALALALVILVPLVFIWRERHLTVTKGTSSEGTGSSVAVLPIINQGNNAQMGALAEGITLNLTNDLAQVSGLRVPSQSIVRDLGQSRDVQAIQRKLKVDTIVNGTIVNAGTEPTLQMELVDVRTGFQLWGQSYTRKQMEDPSLAEDIAEEISYQLRTHNGISAARKLARLHSSVPAAEAAFAQGQKALAEHTYAGFERAVTYFQQAIDADPTYAAAIAELSRSYALMAINNARPEPPLALMTQAEIAARRALRIDSTLAAAYTSLAQVEVLRDYNWSGAEEDFKRAEEVEPDYIPAHVSYALHLLTAQSRFAEARAQLTYADAESPKTLGTSLTGALTAYFSRDYMDSIRQLEQIRRKFHTSAVAIEIEALDYLALNAPNKALKVLLDAPPDPSAPPELRNALRGIALVHLGQRKSALAELKKIETSDQDFDSSYYAAALCAHLGFTDKALAYLQKSRQDRNTSMLFLAVDPLFDSLRSDPRFKSLLKTLNLP